MDATRYSTEEMLARLVGFPTVSDRSNLDLIDFVRAYLGGFGIASELTFDETGEKANLHAVIGPRVDGGVVLSGHTDVVPVAGQNWSGDPFELTERDGKLFGRGTADMKSFAAIALSHVPRMMAANLKRPIHIALSYDEETGCLGAPRMIEAMMREGPRPAAVIVGEPTSMKVVDSHKGTMLLRTTVTGKSVHSSQLNRGVSAITAAARIVAWLDGRTRANIAETPKDSPFDPPYTTLHCGVLEGGTAHNIVARSAWFYTDVRSLPHESQDEWQERYETFVRSEIEPEMKARAAEAEIRIERVSAVPGLQPEENGAAEELARRLTGDNSRNVVVYGTEAGQFQAAGLSTIVCGPGSIDQAHQPDEFIEKAQLLAGEAFIRRLIGELT
ncbi:acetylornithine deacetylase [Stappia sediminis]|uniref:acetylornithine deacetylase n=1 Tax=Stappia sediminis TaxID=2692190 RepID=UPI001FCBD384|nr:acetylornithine deacetylase [Stappia sediminis]